MSRFPVRSFRFFKSSGLCIVTLLVAWLGTPALAAEDPAPEPASIEGLVSDPAGRPVVGAMVLLETPAGLTASATTDGAGRFQVTGLAPGTYVLRARHPGLRTDARTLRLAPGDRLDVPIALELTAVTDTVVVSARQVEDSASSTPAAITVFTADDLRARQIDTAAEALRLTPGVSVAQSGSLGGLTSAFPRGGESDYTLVLVDGVRANTFGGGFDFARLPVAEIERVEVVRGPQSALYGSDAIGGIVQIITRQGGGIRGGGSVEAGSQQTARGAAWTAGSAGGWSWGVASEGAATDGFTGTTTARGEEVTNDDYGAGAVSANVRLALGAWTTAVHGRASRNEKGFAGPFGSDPNGTYGGIDDVSRGWTDDRAIVVQAGATLSPRLRFRGLASWAALDGRFRSPFDTSFNDTRRTDARAQVDVAASGAFGISAGAEFLAEEARSTYIAGADSAPAPVRRGVAGAFVEGRYEVANRLATSIGLRVEHIHRDAVDTDPTFVTGREALPPDTVVSLNPRASVSWFVRSAAPGALSWTRIRANAGTGIRPPDAFEIAFTDNPGLKPERSRSLDVGVEQALFDARLVADATYFANRYDDLLVTVGPAWQDVSRFQTDNIANASARGLEVSATARPAAWLLLRSGYTFLESEVLAVDGHAGEAPMPFTPGDPLTRRPRHQGWAEAVLTSPRWSAFARFGARGRVLDVDPTFGAFGGKLYAAGYTRADLGGEVSVAKHLSIYGRVTNLLDRSYEEVLGFPSPGRTWLGGIRVAAGR